MLIVYASIAVHAQGEPAAGIFRNFLQPYSIKNARLLRMEL
jgi:hypothetical protein